jgi:hypothetical protein
MKVKLTILSMAMVLFPSIMFASEELSKLSSLSYQWENDAIANTDKGYTNGVGFSYVSPDIETWDLPGWTEPIRLALPIFDREGWANNIGISFGQDMYTPDDTDDTEPIYNDRPYGGWLYGAVSIQHKSHERLHKLELTVGVTGEKSHVEQTQTEFHRWIGSGKPMGWDHQIHSRIGAIVSYEHRRRYDVAPWADVIPFGKVSVGNIKNKVSVGSVARFGFNLPHDFHGTRLGASGYALPAGNKTSGWFSAFVFGGVTGHYVASDVFLDEWTIHRDPWVGDFDIGVALRFKRFVVGYDQTFRTKEFKEGSASQFGGVTFSYWF